MSAEGQLDEKPRRRRWSPRQVEEPAQVDVEDEIEDEEEDARGITAPKGRATPGRRQLVEKAEEGNIVTRPVNRVAGYLRDVRSELDKVTWPTRQETLRLTQIVLGTTIVSGLVLGVISLIFTELFRIGVSQPLVFLGVFVIAVAALVYYLRRGEQRSSPY